MFEMRIVTIGSYLRIYGRTDNQGYNEHDYPTHYNRAGVRLGSEDVQHQ